MKQQESPSLGSTQQSSNMRQENTEAKVLSRDSSTLGEARLKAQLAQLEGMNIGHGGDGYNLRLGEPFAVTASEVKSLETLGALHIKRFQVCHRLYLQSLFTGAPAIVKQLAVGGALPKSKGGAP